jgi:uncharacterized protein
VAVKLSNYTILSDRLPGGGYALMNGLTGAIDLINDTLATSIDRVITPLSSQEAYLEEGAVDLELRTYLEERGHISLIDGATEREQVKQIAQSLHDADSQQAHFLIVPNLDCNYRCSYCFERPMQNHLGGLKPAEEVYAKGNSVLDSPQVAAIYTAIDKIQADFGNKGGFIILYGGEPLDAQNLEIVNEIVNRGIAGGYKFGAISNGHDLDKFLGLLGKGKIEQIQISIDGPKEVHDRRRISRLGDSSFDKLITNINLALAQTDAEIQIRVHVDPANIDLFDRTIAIFGEHGWLNHPQVIIYANTVYTKDREGNVSAKMENDAIFKHLQSSAHRYQNVHISAPAIHAQRSLMPSLEQNRPYRLSGTYCGANTGMYIFAPDDHVYACWESVGKACSRIGSYDLAGSLTMDAAAVNRWFSRSVAQIPECLDCPYALICGGGCAQYAEYNNLGTSNHPYCDNFQQVFRTALAENVEAFLSGEIAGIQAPNVMDSRYAVV